MDVVSKPEPAQCLIDEAGLRKSILLADRWARARVFTDTRVVSVPLASVN
jgi:hypothetical protein